MKRHAPAAQRNRGPILQVLRAAFWADMRVLEVASGTGEHAAHFAAGLPRVTWQPTDADPENLVSIEAHRAEAGLTNLLAPLTLDATSDAWPVDSCDAVVCINMVHIAPWAASEGLLRGASRVLSPGGVLVLYGPYRFGESIAPSNAEFDASLTARDPSWGVRDLDAITELAFASGLEREALVAMPANNHSVVFRKLERL